MIRPPASRVESLVAPVPALIYFDVDRKVNSVPEGSRREREVLSAVGFKIQRRSWRIPDRGRRDEGGRKGGLQEGLLRG